MTLLYIFLGYIAIGALWLYFLPRMIENDNISTDTISTTCTVLLFWPFALVLLIMVGLACLLALLTNLVKKLIPYKKER